MDTPRGTARVYLDRPEGRPRALLALGHGAGGGVDAPDLLAVRDRFVHAGVGVARVLQPYRVAGRRAPAPQRQLDEVWCAIVRGLRAESLWRDLPLLTGGRSSGARVACRTAAELGVTGVLALAFPLHPPKRRGLPEYSRAGELAGAGVPVMVVNGEEDRFGIPASSPGVLVKTVAGETHALDRDPAAVAALAVRWLDNLLV